MKGYVANIEKDSIENEDFRRVLYTGPNSQLVLMSLEPGQEIGMEVHKLDQFFRVEDGSGEAVLDGVTHQIQDGSAIVIPAGTQHNITNTSSDKKLKVYTIYSPADHKDQTIHHTKEEALADTEDHFDGKTTE